jgi:hypothetical protein
VCVDESQQYGLKDMFCDQQRIIYAGSTPLKYWSYAFALSKYYELADTLFLILKVCIVCPTHIHTRSCSALPTAACALLTHHQSLRCAITAKACDLPPLVPPYHCFVVHVVCRVLAILDGGHLHPGQCVRAYRNVLLLFHVRPSLPLPRLCAIDHHHLANHANVCWHWNQPVLGQLVLPRLQVCCVDHYLLLARLAALTWWLTWWVFVAYLNHVAVPVRTPTC